MADIDIDDFAETCVTMALEFGINAHYLAAVAMLRSKLKDDVVGNQYGPYLWTQAEWNANPDRSNPALGGAFPPEAVKDWRDQVSVFALMAQRDYTILQAALGHSPSAIELYQKQWSGASDPPLSTDLQKACDDTKQAVLAAINDQLPDPTVAAPVIANPKKPLAPQPQNPGSGSSDGSTAGGAKPAPQPGGSSSVNTDPPSTASSNSVELTGKMSTFGGPNDPGVADDEGLALYDAADGSNLFLAAQPPGTTGLAKRLNPKSYYIACRWDFGLTPKAFLKTNKVKVSNGNKSISAAPVDWGPNASTGRIADLSPQLAAALGLGTDDVCTVQIPLPLMTQQTPAGAGSPSAFATKVDDTATQEWKFFGGQTYDINGQTVVFGHREAEEGWYQRIGTYWLDGTKTSGVDGRNTDMPWSAAFVSWVMFASGAGKQFRYSTQHSVYIYQAIRDLLQHNDAAGFWCWRLSEIKPKIGDIVCWSRQPGIDYDHQNGGDYKGHSDIVVEVDNDKIYVIGGNVGDSVTRRPLALNSAGFLKPTTVGGEILFAVMENRIT